MRIPRSNDKQGNLQTGLKPEFGPPAANDGTNRLESPTDVVTKGGAPLNAATLPPTGSVQALHTLPPVELAPPTPDGIPKPKGVFQGLLAMARDFISGSTAARETNRSRKLVSEINALAVPMSKLSDEQLRAQTPKLKATIAEATGLQRMALTAAEDALSKAGPTVRDVAQKEVREARKALTKAETKVLNKILPEAFATVREGARRSTGMFHFDVQAMAGALMHQGMVAEMYTGEGKTLAATMPSYLAALAGHGFHVVTVNDYLARRDAEEMGEIYRTLGMSVGILQNDHKQFVIDPSKPDEAAGAEKPRAVMRKEAYEADITYGTASEFAFDHLRDNQVRDPQQKVQRPLYGVLLDEVDSLLIDEARTPHILAGQGEDPDKEMHDLARDLVSGLDWKTDVEWDLEEHWVSLTEAGYSKVVDKLGIENLYDEENFDQLYYLDNALRARFLLRKDEHYTEIDGEIRTIGHSGHAMIGRRFTRGLHQALEAKEGLELRPENVTSASITMRDFLGMYQRASGMTGTAVSAKELFQQVYGLDVARVPTRKPLIRVDHPDRVAATAAAKVEMFLDDLEKAHATGRPILVGCEWTSTAEALGEMIKKRGIECNVLGAKTDVEEASIIANAGRIGAVTVATTRGGRGVDIKLGGNAKVVASELALGGKVDAAEAQAQAAKTVAAEKAEVLEKGGLLVMSFEHLDSRRRDDQLRGRAGRQGDPGATVFYASLQDSLFDGVKEAEEALKSDKPIDDDTTRNLTERALDRSENKVNDVLTQSLPYDNIVSMHRQRFYDLRENVLEVADCRPIVHGAIGEALDNVFEEYGKPKKKLESEKDARFLYHALGRLLPLPAGDPPPKWTEVPIREIRADIDKLVDALLDKRDDAVGEEFGRLLERDILVRSLDLAWSGYLDDVQDLREGIGWRAFAQKDPKIEFAIEAASIYDQMVKGARGLMVADLMKKMPKKMPPPVVVTTTEPAANDGDGDGAKPAK